MAQLTPSMDSHSPSTIDVGSNPLYGHLSDGTY